MTPMGHTDEFGNKANGMYYRDFCRYCREYEPMWDAVKTNKAWSEFAKESR